MDTFTPQPRPVWVAGRAEQGEATSVVHHPFDGSDIATVAVPGPGQLDRAVAAAATVAPKLRRCPARELAEVLDRISRGVSERAEELAEQITAEAGKPIKWSEVEVRRASSVFRNAAEEVRAGSGEVRRLCSGQDDDGLALVRRAPRGPVLGITPVTVPLGLVAHKVAAALASGAPIVVKPSRRAPLSALVLGEILAEAGLPEGAFSVLPCGEAEAGALVADPRLPVVSFTGSSLLGRSISAAAPGKHVVLDVRGGTAAVVLGDWPDPADAAARIATFAGYQAGQSGFAVRQVIVERPAASAFVPALLDAVRALRVGDPYDPAVEVGPVLDAFAAQRVTDQIAEAVTSGARVLTGGSREGATVEPTVLTDVPRLADAAEISGPVLIVSVVDSSDAALSAVSASAAGVGIFTRDVGSACRASAELPAREVVIGDVASERAEQMSYDRDGIRTAMRDLTTERVTVLTGLGW